VAYSIRITQNKAKKESKEVRAKELNELRKENQVLKRDNARLRRDLDKYLSYVPDEPEFLESLDIKVEQKTNENSCPGCNTTLTTIDLGAKILVVCKACKWRTTK
jgi:formamidopyrimidine-DNA glycosylase